jgi:hypothetical protein
MLRAMTDEVTAKTVEPTPTAVISAATTWAEFPNIWPPMLDEVWTYLRSDAAEGLYQDGQVVTATHTGPIASIGDTYQALRAWSTANGYRLAGPRWEVYGDPEPSTGDFDVEVYWSLE